MSGVGRDERAWVRGAQAGSASDLEALFRAFWPRAYRAAYLVAHDAAAAEDIAQESFLAAIRSLDRFDRRRPFGPWLHRIVVNRAIDYARARQLRAESELHELGADPPELGDAQGLAGARPFGSSSSQLLSPRSWPPRSARRDGRCSTACARQSGSSPLRSRCSRFPPAAACS